MPRARRRRPSVLRTPTFLRKFIRGVAMGLSLAGVGVGTLQVADLGFKPLGDAPVAVLRDAIEEAAAGRFARCRDYFPGPPPEVAAPGLQRALCFDSFAVLHSGESKTPVYTVERLSRARMMAARTVPRVDHFYPEARLPSAHRAQLEDYRGSGYDRGHLAPAADMPNASAKAQSFSLANMVPQAPVLNQGAWSQIEQATRDYALRAPGDVYVFGGPQFGPQPRPVGPGRVWVPAATWKLVYTPATGRAWAYWMRNDAGPHSLAPISYEQFVQRSGLRLLPDALAGGSHAQAEVPEPAALVRWIARLADAIDRWDAAMLVSRLRIYLVKLAG